MATIQNDRDILLQAASPRVVPPPIPIDQIEGLPEAIKRLAINATGTTFVGSSGTTSPATITLTAERLNGLSGPVVWAVIAGSGTVSPAGDVCTVTGSTVSGQTITLRARVTEASVNYDAQITLTKLGSLAGQASVNLATQITGQLANGNVSGLGALALLGSVSLTNPAQVVGDLAASRIGVGTLAAGVIYAGTINVANLVGSTISGKDLSGSNRIFLGGSTESAPFAAYMNGGSAFFGVSGYTSIASGNGAGGVGVNPTLGVSISGATCYVSSALMQITSPTLNLGQALTNLTVNGATLSGSLGSRIILKNVVYNVSVSGGPATTVEFI